LDLSVVNLKSGKPVSSIKVSSPEIRINQLSSLADSQERLGGVWIIEENELPVKRMNDFVDYQINGTVVEFQKKKKINQNKFSIFLMRDYKSVPAADLKYIDNWTVGPSTLLSQEDDSVVQLRDGIYDNGFGRILTIINRGKLSIFNGELVFDEDPDSIDVFYREKINEEYKWVDGKLKRFWEYKKKHVDPSPYFYKTIYERGFSSKK